MRRVATQTADQVESQYAPTRFSECLARLLMQYDISPRQLAAVLGYGRADRPDPTVIYRWLRDEQVPGYSSPHLRAIADYLHLPTAEQEQLKQAHLTSLDDPRPRRCRHRKQQRSTAPATATVERLLYQTALMTGPADRFGARPTRAREAGRDNANVMGASGAVHLTSERRQVLDLAIQILEHVPPAPSQSGRDPSAQAEIYLTMQGHDAFEGLPDLEAEWRQAARHALQQGWSICHLWRIDRDVERAVHLVETMLDLVGTGSYAPRYFDRYGTLTPPYDLLIVPGVAAMVLLATENPHYADTAFIIQDPAHIQRLRGHFQQLLAHTRPLIRTFFAETEEFRFTQAIVETEAYPGGRLMLKYGPSGVTHPLAWCNPSSDSPHHKRVRPTELNDYASLLRQRVAQFEQNVQSYEFRDIYPKRAIQRLAELGEYPPDDLFADSAAPPNARLDHLHRLIYLLRRYPRYHIALVDDVEQGRSGEGLIPIGSNWEIAGERHVFLETWLPDATGTPTQVNVIMTEPMIALAFREYFTQLWDHRIADQNKNREYVIDWLTRQAHNLEHRLQDNHGG